MGWGSVAGGWLESGGLGVVGEIPVLFFCYSAVSYCGITEKKWSRKRCVYISFSVVGP